MNNSGVCLPVLAVLVRTLACAATTKDGARPVKQVWGNTDTPLTPVLSFFFITKLAGVRSPHTTMNNHIFATQNTFELRYAPILQIGRLPTHQSDGIVALIRLAKNHFRSKKPDFPYRAPNIFESL